MADRQEERSAFPFVFSNDGGGPGMTLQEWYFGVAMQGLLADGQTDDEPEDQIVDVIDDLTDRAWQIASAMIEKSL
jgi:hypothetical protein